MLENKRVQKPREFWISIAYFRASTVIAEIYILVLHLTDLGQSF